MGCQNAQLSRKSRLGVKTENQGMHPSCTPLSPEFTCVNYDASVRCTSGVRFLSEDPLGFEAGINFYAYVGNNPLNFNDPSGNVCVPCAGALINAGAGALVRGLTPGQSAFDPTAITIDLVVGATGAGIAANFARLSTLGRAGTSALVAEGSFLTTNIANKQWGQPLAVPSQ